jgi:hypothetical protein
MWPAGELWLAVTVQHHENIIRDTASLGKNPKSEFEPSMISTGSTLLSSIVE